MKLLIVIMLFSFLGNASFAQSEQDTVLLYKKIKKLFVNNENIEENLRNMF